MGELRAVLGPTNTGKTHLAVERMLAHESGMIGLPLRLLAREVYDKIVAAKGHAAAALVTGEERIIPAGARYYACTVEAMPTGVDPAFLAIDEVQLAADPDRGHVFTDRILHARGRQETMLLGAETMRPALSALELDVDAEPRERFSQLTYVGPLKITKLPKRSAVVAFSSEEVYAIAELLRRQRGGAAVVMGALSPRTRNAQVELYQSGEVDYLVATDAIGMGLNMDVGHVAFASRRKFDGRRRRPLRADEAAQIAGRAGRFRDDGGFGETSDCQPFDEEMVSRIENHRFDAVERLSWRNSDLDFRSVDRLLASLRRPSPAPILRRCADALDEVALEALARDPDIGGRVDTPERTARVWTLCGLPDFRKSGPDGHIRLVKSLAEHLIDPDARLKDDWLYGQISKLDRTEGDIDTLQSRLAQIRTWTYAANRDDWMEHAHNWRGRTREIEDRLSDALHERLMQRFVDRRTSALLKRLNSEDSVDADLSADGDVRVDGHLVGRLNGLRFEADVKASTLEGRAVRNAAAQALTPVIEQKLRGVAAAEGRAFNLSPSGDILFEDAVIARLVKGPDWLSPEVELVGADHADPNLRETARGRALRFVRQTLEVELAPLWAVKRALRQGDLSGLARGAAHQLTEAGAAIDRRKDGVAGALGRQDREALKAVGVRTGRICAYLPGLLKPAPANLCLGLRALFEGQAALKSPGSASFPTERGWSTAMLSAAGYVRLGSRAVRADMAERLSWSLGQARNASDSAAFEAPAELAALIGCPADAFPAVLSGLGLKPARKNKETGAAELWRFTSQKRAAERRKRESSKAVSDSPFAALAALAPAEPAPPKRRRRRGSKRTAAKADAGAAPKNASGEPATATEPAKGE